MSFGDFSAFSQAYSLFFVNGRSDLFICRKCSILSLNLIFFEAILFGFGGSDFSLFVGLLNVANSFLWDVLLQDTRGGSVSSSLMLIFCFKISKDIIFTPVSADALSPKTENC